MTKKNKKTKNLFFPFDYTKDKYFFWISTNYKSILKNISDIKKIYPSKEEFCCLESKIKSIEDKLNGEQEFILINPLFKNIIDSMKKKIVKLSNISENIKNIITSFPKNKTFYIKDIKNDYYNKYKERLSNKKIYNIIKYKLNYRFKRTSVKNNKLISTRGLLMSFLFYKTVLRGLQIGLDIIYIDESGFQLINNKYSRWRLKEEEYPYGPKNNPLKKINLICAVSYNDILCYHLNENNTNNELFIKFLKELFEKIPEESKKDKLVIMDNAKFHLTKEVKEIFEKSQIKVITISPYNSDQNMIELVFRHIKNIIKKYNFKTISKMKNKIIEILGKEETKITLMKLYKSTLLY